MQNMLHITKDYLDKAGVFQTTLTPVINKISEAILIPNVPERMKNAIAVSEIITFASQFRRNIVTKDDTSIPINTISFVLAGSGIGKDSAVRAARKCFKPGYDMVEAKRKQLSIAEAKQAAADAGEEFPDAFEVFKKYLKPLPPVFMSPTTGPGFIQHTNDLNSHKLGAGLLYSG